MASETDTDIPAETPAHTAADHLVSGTRTFGTALLNVLERLSRWTLHELAKPAVRTVVVGVILIIVGVFFIDHSVWTFPLVIIGALMIIGAWVGTRLEGRFGIEWNDGGARMELRAGFKPRNAALTGPTMTSTSTTPIAPVTPLHTSARHLQSDVIDGEAHTIEIDVDELRALVAAAERGSSAASATTNGTPVTWQETAPSQDGGTDETVN